MSHTPRKPDPNRPCSCGGRWHYCLRLIGQYIRKKQTTERCQCEKLGARFHYCLRLKGAVKRMKKATR